MVGGILSLVILDALGVLNIKYGAENLATAAL